MQSTAITTAVCKLPYLWRCFGIMWKSLLRVTWPGRVTGIFSVNCIYNSSIGTQLNQLSRLLLVWKSTLKYGITDFWHSTNTQERNRAMQIIITWIKNVLLNKINRRQRITTGATGTKQGTSQYIFPHHPHCLQRMPKFWFCQALLTARYSASFFPKPMTFQMPKSYIFPLRSIFF